MKNESYTMTYVGLHALFADGQGRILLIRRCPTNRYMPLKWDIPGGKRQSGESILCAIRREVAEETGLSIREVLAPLSVYVNSTQLPTREDVQIVFRCTVADAEAAIVLNTREHDRYEWVAPTRLKEYDLMAYLEYCYEEVLRDENEAAGL